jgi:Rrf2 family nitric oxide-sensitive transcriptional repressor
MLSATQEYALRAMTQLARTAPDSATTADIAKSVRVPSAYLNKVLQHMRRAGLVKSQRGVGGGVALAKPPKRISLLEVIEAVSPWQNGAGKSALDRKLKAIGDAFRKSAAATSLADVAK